MCIYNLSLLYVRIGAPTQSRTSAGFVGRVYVIGMVLKQLKVSSRVKGVPAHGAKNWEHRAREARAVNFPARTFQKFGFTFSRK